MEKADPYDFFLWILLNFFILRALYACVVSGLEVLVGVLMERDTRSLRRIEQKWE